MKKTYLIIAGCTLVVLLLAIWVYLLIYGTPKPVEQFFTDFNLGDNSELTTDTPFIPEDTTERVDVVDAAPLRQLTTRAVIGYGEYSNNTENKNVIRYAEAGTGHVYEINLLTGTEIRLSNITIPNVEAAQFSPDGTKVAIGSGFGNQNTIQLLTLAGENSATKETLSPKMVDFIFNDNNELLYTEYSSAGQSGNLLKTDTKTSQTLFTVPFQNATIVWSIDGDTQHYVYPKPSAKLNGFLYRLQNGTLIRESASGEGLTAEINAQYYIHTITTDNGPVSFVTDRTTGTRASLPIIVEPSKCVFAPDNNKYLYCGHEGVGLTNEFPDNWYKGLISFSDKLYKIDLEKSLAAQLVSPEQETGRELDVIDMNISQEGKVLYFINKNDNTLWMYEI